MVIIEFNDIIEFNNIKIAYKEEKEHEWNYIIIDFLTLNLLIRNFGIKITKNTDQFDFTKVRKVNKSNLIVRTLPSLYSTDIIVINYGKFSLKCNEKYRNINYNMYLT